MNGAARGLRSSWAVIELRRLPRIVREKHYGVALSHGLEQEQAKSWVVCVPGAILCPEMAAREGKTVCFDFRARSSSPGGVHLKSTGLSASTGVQGRAD
jgi:hypothetical protein